jgi:hypothetical protein
VEASFDLRAVAESLAAWSGRHRVVEDALARYRAWLAESGRHVIAEARFRDQALVFRTGADGPGPVVVTRFTLTAVGGMADVGTLEAYTALDGSPAGLSVAIDPGWEPAGPGAAAAPDGPLV